MKKSRTRIVGLVVIIVSLLWGAGYYFWELNQPIWICKEQVKDRLKAPSTAIFSKVEVRKTKSYWTVVGGIVESQNWFGGMKKMGFYCQDYNKNLKSFFDVLFNEGVDKGVYDLIDWEFKDYSKQIEDADVRLNKLLEEAEKLQ